MTILVLALNNSFGINLVLIFIDAYDCHRVNNISLSEQKLNAHVCGAIVSHPVLGLALPFLVAVFWMLLLVLCTANAVYISYCYCTYKTGNNKI